MTTPDSTLALRFIHARNYRPDRLTHGVELIVLHSTEGGGSAASVAAWFASLKAPQASAHYVVDAGEAIQCVREQDVAWHAPPVNEDLHIHLHETSIGIEHLGWAKWSAAEWPAALIQRSAELVADICRRHTVPAVWVDAAGLLRGARGVTTHAEVSKAFRKSTHTDPGAGFDVAGVLRMANECLDGATPPDAPAPPTPRNCGGHELPQG